MKAQLTINGEEYVLASSIKNSERAVNTEGMKYVIVRTYSAGVFAGYFESRNGQEVVLRNVVLEQPCFVEITWFCKNAKKDPDNIVFAKKFVMDGLVMAGVLKNDTMRYILGFMDMVNIDRTNPRIEINLLTY